LVATPFAEIATARPTPGTAQTEGIGPLPQYSLRPGLRGSRLDQTVPVDRQVSTVAPANPPPPPDCSADLNGDGIVGINDFLDLLAAWGPCP